MITGNKIKFFLAHLKNLCIFVQLNQTSGNPDIFRKQYCASCVRLQSLIVWFSDSVQSGRLLKFINFKYCLKC